MSLPAAWAYLVAVDPRTPVETLERLARELHRWNRSVRLVGPRDLDGVRAQVADALVPFLYLPPKGPVLDIGCGPGLPALPLAAMFPEVAVVGLEPRHKRVAFARHAARLLGLEGVRIVAERSEDAIGRHPDLAGRFATVTARAVADVPGLLAAARPYLAPGGKVVLPRGKGTVEPGPGWARVEHREYPPPPGAGPRAVGVFARAPG